MNQVLRRNHKSTQFHIRHCLHLAGILTLIVFPILSEAEKPNWQEYPLHHRIHTRIDCNKKGGVVFVDLKFDDSAQIDQRERGGEAIVRLDYTAVAENLDRTVVGVTGQFDLEVIDMDGHTRIEHGDEFAMRWTDPSAAGSVIVKFRSLFLGPPGRELNIQFSVRNATCS
jgi:hypothetical protein